MFKKKKIIKKLNEELFIREPSLDKIYFLLFPGLGKEGENTFWKIKKKLKTYYPNSIVIDFGTIGICSISYGIEERAKLFAKKLNKKINLHGDNKFIAICHSQGGITFLNMLDIEDIKASRLINNLLSINFLGCPFGGNKWADITVDLVHKLTLRNKVLNLLITKPFFAFVKKFYKFLGLKIKDVRTLQGFKSLRPSSTAIDISNKVLKQLLSHPQLKLSFFHGESDIVVSKNHSHINHILCDLTTKVCFVNTVNFAKIGHMGLLYKDHAIEEMIKRL